jgi:hypothetical protein
MPAANTKKLFARTVLATALAFNSQSLLAQEPVFKTRLNPLGDLLAGAKKAAKAPLRLGAKAAVQSLVFVGSRVEITSVPLYPPAPNPDTRPILSPALPPPPAPGSDAFSRPPLDRVKPVIFTKIDIRRRR